MSDSEHATGLMPWFRTACGELTAPLAQLRSDDIQSFITELCNARRIALVGVGREGLMMRALAMRLYHLGLDAHPVGDMTTPALAAGDCLVASAGPGHFATVGALLQVARASGARTTLLTANAESPLGSVVDTRLLLPARTMGPTAAAAGVLPMGSAYEGALFLLFEYVVDRLRGQLGVSESAMRARHTNLE